MVYRNILLVLVRGGAVLLPAVVIVVSTIMYTVTTLPLTPCSKRCDSQQRLRQSASRAAT